MANKLNDAICKMVDKQSSEESADQISVLWRYRGVPLKQEEIQCSAGSAIGTWAFPEQ